MSIKGIAGIIILVVAQLGFADIAPSWVNVLPIEENKIFAIGLAPMLIPVSQSITNASNNAKQELLLGLRSTIKGEVNTTSSIQTSKSIGAEVTASSFNQARTNVVMTANMTDLLGLRVVETYTDSAGKTIYALAELDVKGTVIDLQNKNTQIANNFSAFTGIKKFGLDEIYELKEVSDKNTHIQDLVGIFGTYVDPALTLEIRVRHDNIRKILMEAKKSIAFGLTVSKPHDINLASSIRQIVTAAGFSWSDESPSYNIVIQDVSGVRLNATYGVVVSRSVQEVILVDDDDRVMKSTKLSLKGVGGSEGEAVMLMEKQMDTELHKVIGRWLGL